MKIDYFKDANSTFIKFNGVTYIVFWEETDPDPEWGSISTSGHTEMFFGVQEDYWKQEKDAF